MYSFHERSERSRDRPKSCDENRNRVQPLETFSFIRSSFGIADWPLDIDVYLGFTAPLARVGAYWRGVCRKAFASGCDSAEIHHNRQLSNAASDILVRGWGPLTLRTGSRTIANPLISSECLRPARIGS